jgi:hypothetical protein
LAELKIKVLFLADPFRPSPTGETGFYNLWSDTIVSALAPVIMAGVEAEVVAVKTGSAKGQIDQFELCRLQGAPFGFPLWMSTYSGAEALSSAAKAYLGSFIGSAVVIGFELGQAIKQWMQDEGVPYLDITMCPFQFMRDLGWALRSNMADINHRLSNWGRTRSEIAMEAGHVRATLKHSLAKPYESDLHDAVLFCAGTAIDRTLINNGKFATFMDFEQEVRALASEHEHVLFRPHPYGFSTREERDFFENLENVQFTTTNIYHLMSEVHGLKQVVSLSSSASIEAPFFGKSGRNLVRPPADMCLDPQERVPQSDQCVVILHDDWDPAFWRDILDGYVNLQRRPARGRSSTANAWRNVFCLYGPASDFEITPSHVAYDHFRKTNFKFDSQNQTDPRIQHKGSERKSPYAKLEIIRGQVNENKLDGVEDIATEILGEDPGIAEAWYLRSLARCGPGTQRDLDGALLDIETALDKGFDPGWCCSIRIQILLQSGRTSEALMDWTQAHQTFPTHPGVQSLASLMRDLESRIEAQ